MTDAYNNAPAAEQAGTETQRTGPPEGRYALNESFEKDFDQWLVSESEENRLKDGGRFLIGTTSNKLNRAGVDNYQILFGKSKIAKIMQNPEMTPDVMKDAVKVVENPVIVLD